MKSIFSLSAYSVRYLALPLFLYTSSLMAGPYLWEMDVGTMDHVAMTASEQQEGSLMWVMAGKLVRGIPTYTVPATSTVNIPEDGTYFVWAFHQVSPVRRKTFTIRLDGHELLFCPLPYGKTPEERPEIYQNAELSDKNLLWTFHAVVLKAGEYPLELSSKVTEQKPKGGGHPPVVSQIVITNDPSYKPSTP